jgi:hypothetical protein
MNQRKRNVKGHVAAAGGGAALVIALLLWLGGGLGFPGGGGGSGASLAPSPPTEPASKPVEPVDPLADGILDVEIRGSSLYVGDKEYSAHQIADLAASRKDSSTGQPAPAQVSITRSADATVRAKESLLKILDERRIPHTIK